MGEEAYYERLKPLLAEQGDHYRFPGYAAWAAS